ncbi:MAG: hypothetical protein HW405_818 [Candidatus Berkelbacteria bacterium]|nr:hypothetical protein [Candidatus Berkelbacteria bacterium]
MKKRIKILLIILGAVLIAFGIVMYFYSPYSEAARGGWGHGKQKSSPSPTLTVTAATTPTFSPTTTSGGVPSPIYGVTVDDTSGISNTVTALSKLSKKPTVRIVFDPGMRPADYQTAVDQIRTVAYTMGQPVDSDGMKNYTLDQYKARFTEYLSAFGSKIDIWEVGNEVNGEWLGSATDVSAKISAAYDIVKGAGKTTALTLHFNEGADCPTYPINEMYSWANTYVPDKMKQGTDYVLFSYYPENCPEIKPVWNVEFTKIGNIFPNAKLGFGEIGMNGGTDAQKATLVNEFYPMQISHPRYVKGVFWWYFKEEMVPYTNYLWGVLNQSFTK